MCTPQAAAYARSVGPNGALVLAVVFMDPKHYTDAEMTAILRRAAALQAVDPEPRHSLAEIAERGAQVGLPTALIQQAAFEMEQPLPRTTAAA
jgi:hypothetical protein